MQNTQAPNKINISVRMPPHLREELRREALTEETTLGEYIRAQAAGLRGRRVTARAAFTQAQVRRAIAVARKEGLPICGIRPDGTVITHMPDGAVAPSVAAGQDGPSSEWEDFTA
jgi:hypothetical protein